MCTSCRASLPWFVKVSSFTVAMWILLWMGNAYTSEWVSTKISWTAEPLKRFWVGMLVMVVYTVSAVYGLILIFRYAFDVNLGDASGMIYSSLIVTFLISSFMHARGFLQNLKQATIDAEIAKKESIRAQYEALKNQVNPHFLFNSLNALTNLVYTDQDKAALFIKKMAEVYRYVLDTRDKELVDVNEELNFAESFIYLQQIRFGENLKVDYQIDSKTGKVAPLAVQMLIENAIKHNEISAEHPLTITLLLKNDFISVVNSVRLKNNPLDQNSGVGLENIRKRYEFLTHIPVEIKKESGRFEVKIPILNIE
jgi:LytS/YehU family sensor histidine kinase